MSRRSQVTQQRKALEHISRPAQPHVPVQLGIGQLAEILISQGAPRGYKIQTSDDPKVVRVVATCGELAIPLDFSPEEARKLGKGINDAADLVDPPAAEEEPVMTSPEAEALLAEFTAAAEEREGAVQMLRDTALNLLAVEFVIVHAVVAIIVLVGVVTKLFDS